METFKAKDFGWKVAKAVEDAKKKRKEARDNVERWTTRRRNWTDEVGVQDGVRVQGAVRGGAQVCQGCGGAVNQPTNQPTDHEDYVGFLSTNRSHGRWFLRRCSRRRMAVVLSSSRSSQQLSVGLTLLLCVRAGGRAFGLVLFCRWKSWTATLESRTVF